MRVKDLKVYQKSYKLALNIHKITLKFPNIEQYGGIADQLRRSSKSIVANIVEGYSKQNFYRADFKKMLIYSLASCDETQLWIKMSKDLGYIEEGIYNAIYQNLEEIGKMTYSLIKKQEEN